ncbi:MAG: 3-deoxy-D-manno-octulosonate 8-phosphate phosphatase [Candidatus Methylomirabilota bacterium]|nr:3-deoxy-D-manno-octulosonate 8-phosphate phosphatase [candidate division NC10 bacterium]PWB47583.1 MAG: 3-deoxy-D-manno-octulosonate 8-phosphate phosphatase [candidate division NC10 bacterium]
MRASTPAREARSLEELIRAIRLVVFDFDGVFTDNTVYVFEDGREAVRCFRGDGIGLQKLERLGVATLIISTETNPVVSARSRKLGIRCVQGCHDKRAVLESNVLDMGLSLTQVAFVGNDINDLPCLTRVVLPIVVQDAHPDVIPYARYQTSVRGGYGAVREICDLFERVLTAPVTGVIPE